jgi:hypothetical protein
VCKKELEGSTVRIQQAEEGTMVICNPTVEYRVLFQENGLTLGLKAENTNGDVFEEAAQTGEGLDKLGSKVEKLVIKDEIVRWELQFEYGLKINGSTVTK